MRCQMSLKIHLMHSYLSIIATDMSFKTDGQIKIYFKWKRGIKASLMKTTTGSKNGTPAQ